MSVDWLTADLLWRNALAVVPLALLVAVIARFGPCRPATRHALWLVVLGLLVVSPWLPRVSLPQSPAGPPAGAGAPAPGPAPRRVAEAPPASAGPPATALFPQPADLSPQPADPAPQPAEPPSAAGALAAGPAGPPPRDRAAERPPASPSASAASRRPPSRPAARADAVPRRHEPRAAEPPPPPADQARPRAAAVADAPATPPPAAGPWRRWLEAVRALRDAVMSLPALPVPVWGLGAAALLVLAAARIRRARGRLSRGRPAPPPVVRMVAEVAGQLGLRRAPVALMLDEPVAPMIWCGRRTCLVLPELLWNQLDDVGRRAVIVHELAHLRRRDHWVAWIEMIVGWIYWWHPVLWWARRRIREEADLCCDVWVTACLPEGRRAYAQALLETRRCSGRAAPVPAVGLGAATLRARRFARRLTMVMTARTSPRLSTGGVLLACALAVGWIGTTPLWACPEKNEKTEDRCDSAKKRAIRERERALAPPRAPRAPAPPAAPAPPETTFERFMQERPGPAPGPAGPPGSLEQRIDRLERQLDRLERQLRRLLGDVEDLGSELPRLRSGELTVEVPDPPEAVLYAPLQLGFGGGVGGGFGVGDVRHDGEMIVRTYRLPEGKLEALSDLMIRSDLPVRVRPLDEGIEVHATRGQHRAFHAFCLMIRGNDRVEDYELPDGKLEALTGLMARSDVPVLIERRSESIGVHGGDLVQTVFAEFVNLIHPGAAETGVEVGVGPAPDAMAETARRYESRAAAVAGRQARAEQRQRRHALRAAHRSLNQQAGAFEREAERLERRAERLERKAEELERKAEAVEREMEDTEGPRRDVLRSEIEVILAQAEALEVQAAALQEQAQRVERQAEALEEEAERLEDELEAIEEDEDEEDDR